MPANDIIVRAVVDVSSATRDWRAFLDELRKTYPTVDLLKAALQEAEDAMKQLASANKRSSDEFKKQQKDAQGLRQILGELAKESKKVEEQEKATAKAGDTDKIKEAIQAHNDLIAQYKKEYTSIEQIDAKLNQLRADRNAVQGSTEANTQAGRDAVNGYNQEINALEQVRGGLVKTKNETDANTAAQEKLKHATALQLKQALLWIAGSASAYYVFRKLRNAVNDLVKEFLKNTDEAKALEAASVNLKASLFAAFGPEVLEAARTLAKIINDIADAITRTAVGSGVKNDLLAIFEQQRKAGTATLAASAQAFSMKVSGYLTPAEQAYQNEFLAKALGLTTAQYNALNEAARAGVSAAEADFIARTAEEDALKKVASAAKTLTDRVLELAKAQRESNQTASDAFNAYNAARLKAEGTLTAELHTIQVDLAKQITAINVKAQQARTNAYIDYQLQIADLQRQAARQEQADAERHALEMEYAQRRHQLDMIQNERIYQYSREQLVAEGDVLAIEDLDARYELERQAQEENYQLQQEQAEAMYQLQARLQQEAMRDQMQALQSALQEQLRQIEESRRQEIAEAEAAAAEKNQAAKDAYAQALTDAEATYVEAQNAQAQADADQLQANAEFLAQFAIDNNLKLADVLAAWTKVYGPDPSGQLATAAQQAYDLIASLTKLALDALEPLYTAAGTRVSMAFKTTLIAGMRSAMAEAQTIMSSISSMSNYGNYGGLGVPNFPGGEFGFVGGTGRTYGFQHGGEMIVSQPTQMTVGEHGTSERVIVQPLSAIGGNIGVSWRGGAIPLHGTGSLTGADVGAMSGVFNQMLRSFAMEYVKQRSSIRGQRGR